MASRCAMLLSDSAKFMPSVVTTCCCMTVWRIILRTVSFLGLGGVDGFAVEHKRQMGKSSELWYSQPGHFQFASGSCMNR